jgi:hypothetical protein
MAYYNWQDDIHTIASIMTRRESTSYQLNQRVGEFGVITASAGVIMLTYALIVDRVESGRWFSFFRRDRDHIQPTVQVRSARVVVAHAVPDGPGSDIEWEENTQEDREENRKDDVGTGVDARVS